MAESKEDIWASIGPDGVTELMKLGGYDDEQIRVAAQLAEAQAIRSAKGPKGRHTGRTYVAANPLEHLGDFLGKRTAKKDITKAEARQTEIQGLQAAGRERIAEAFFKQQQGPPAMPGSGGGGPMGPPLPPQGPPPQGPPPQGPPPQPPLPQPSPNIPPSGIQGQQAGPGPDLSGGMPMDAGQEGGGPPVWRPPMALNQPGAPGMQGMPLDPAAIAKQKQMAAMMRQIGTSGVF